MSAAASRAPGASGPGFEVINPPNRLKEKVGTGTGFDAATLARAQQAVDDLGVNFKDEAQAVIDRMTRLMEQAGREPDGRAARVHQIYELVFDLKGLGETFDYPLVTEVGNSLCRFAEDLPGVTDIDVEVVKAHVDALATVFKRKIAGDGGATGRAVVAGLDQAVAKYKERR